MTSWANWRVLRITFRNHHLYREWSNKEELDGLVSTALLNHIGDDQDAGKPRPGWYRGDVVPDATDLRMVEEFARISEENNRLRSELAATKTELDAIKAASSPGPKLMLVDRDDMPLPPKISATRDLVGSWTTPVALERVVEMGFGRKLLALNLLTRLEIGVQNISDTLIEAVIIDISLEHIQGLYCRWSGAELAENEGALDSAKPSPRTRKIAFD